jgi:hypothetical protein
MGQTAGLPRRLGLMGLTSIRKRVSPDFEISAQIMFLVGVFLDDLVPSGAPPPRLDFSGNEHFSELSPVIGQTFFIGDGLTGGTPKSFHVPSTATRFFLGFADGAHFHGAPGLYADNSGQVSAQFAMNNSTCASGTSINNVLLPQVDVPVTVPLKPWNIRYGSIGLNFLLSSPTSPNVICTAQSTVGTLNVFAFPTGVVERQ